jgi:hypothetical protein
MANLLSALVTIYWAHMRPHGTVSRPIGAPFLAELSHRIHLDPSRWPADRRPDHLLDGGSPLGILLFDADREPRANRFHEGPHLGRHVSAAAERIAEPLEVVHVRPQRGTDRRPAASDALGGN